MPEPRSISFFVPGLPVAKGRARTATRKKRDGSTFIAHITPEKTVSYERQVRLWGKRAFSEPLTGALEVRAVFYFEPAPSLPRGLKAALYGTYKSNGADIDNFAKALLDGLNRQPIKRARPAFSNRGGLETVGWDLVAWTDDSQVARLLLAKKYISAPDQPVGVSVTITELAR